MVTKRPCIGIFLGARSDVLQEDCPGIIRLRLRGFAKYFDKELSVDDPKLRRQLVLLNTRVGTTTPHHATSYLHIHIKEFSLVEAAPDANVHMSGEDTKSCFSCGLVAP